MRLGRTGCERYEAGSTRGSGRCAHLPPFWPCVLAVHGYPTLLVVDPHVYFSELQHARSYTGFLPFAHIVPV